MLEQITHKLNFKKELIVFFLINKVNLEVTFNYYHLLKKIKIKY